MVRKVSNLCFIYLPIQLMRWLVYWHLILSLGCIPICSLSFGKDDLMLQRNLEELP